MGKLKFDNVSLRLKYRQKGDASNKNINDELGLAWLDFGARNYDAALGRWMNIDLLADIAYDRTPYHYVSNNPLNRIDPDGLTDYKLNTETGKVTRVGDKNDDPDRIVKTDSDGNVKRKGEGFLGFLVRKSERGKAKIAKEGISKGFLEDGKNLKNNRTKVKIGGDGQPTLSEAKSSVIKISEYLGKELTADLWKSNKKRTIY